MICPTCDRSNPEDAHFCIYCAAPLVAAETSTAVPTTSSAERLAPSPGMAVSEPAAAAAPVSAPEVPSVPSVAWWNSRREQELGGAVWLIGLGLLFLTGTFWPGILVLLGITTYLHETARGRQEAAVRSVIFFCGLAALFWSGLFWPGILILAGLTALLSPEIRPRHGRA